VSPLLPPKGTDPGSCGFPCKPVVFRGPEGAIIAIVDPGKPTPWWWAQAMPPLWQYFSRLPGRKQEPRVTFPHAGPSKRLGRAP
jgi:hypothetical protein